jgi:hypothetical protein
MTVGQNAEDAPMIDGLKLTFSGEELRTLLEVRIGHHRVCAHRWAHERTRTAEDETEDAPLLPEHICANEAERHDWRAARLGAQMLPPGRRSGVALSASSGVRRWPATWR